MDFEKAIKDLNFFPGMFRASYSSRSPVDATTRSHFRPYAYQDSHLPQYAMFTRRAEAKTDAQTLLAVPVIAAINGHAFAGGLMLSLACDYRVMTDGTKRNAWVCMNEVMHYILPFHWPA